MSDVWIQTHSGIRFDILDPKPEMVAIDDIAHALSKLCRFQCQCRWTYTVAQHSIHASYQLGGWREAQLWLLLHDAAEAYVGDLARPTKSLLPEYKTIEKRILSVIAKKFIGCDMPPVVAKIDMQMLATERRDLMSRHEGVDIWTCLDGVEPFVGRIHPWLPEYAKHAFVERYVELAKNP